MVETLYRNAKLVVSYLAHHWLFALVGFYFFVSLLLFNYTSINIAIPCLIKLTTGLTCPGCGLSHAFAHMLKFEFVEAWHHNKLSFVIVPAGSYYIIKDFISYRKTCLSS